MDTFSEYYNSVFLSVISSISERCIRHKTPCFNRLPIYNGDKLVIAISHPFVIDLEKTESCIPMFFYCTLMSQRKSLSRIDKLR